MKKSTGLMILGLILVSFAWGQVPNLPAAANREANMPLTAANSSTDTPALTAADVEAFLNGVVPIQLAREDIAGATIAIVKDGKLLFARGYGFSDVVSKKPVLPEETLFRTGSVGKLFTWTAVMQLVEQGKLDLNRDVNEYLDFKIPDAYGKPITLTNILTHTPGFEEQLKDFFAADNKNPDLGQYVKTHIPARIYPPGTVPAYSNYATTLAGYIVERVSGQPYAEYIDEHIFKPLGMTRSTFVQPLPPSLAPFMSSGYLLASDDAKPFESLSPFPAGSQSSTATDMARFMLAFLQEGQADGARILRPETVRLMHTRLFALDDAANAMLHGFYESRRNGKRIIGHAGDTTQFHSELHLIPDSAFGFFISYNSTGRGQISPRTILWEAFLDRYFPYTPSDLPSLESAKQDAQAVSGTYMISRRPEKSFLRILALAGEITVTPRDDGSIEIGEMTDPNGKPKRFREVAPMTFRDVNGQDTLIFKPDANGQMQIILPFPFMVFQRVGISENKKILLPVFVVSLVIMLLTLILWPVAWFVRRQYGYKLELARLDWWLRVGVRLVFTVNLLFMIFFAALLVYTSDHFDFLSDRGNTWFHLAQAIGVLGAVGTLVVLYNAFRCWTNKKVRIWGKLQATLFVLVCFGFLWFAFVGNLLRFSSSF